MLKKIMNLHVFQYFLGYPVRTNPALSPTKTNPSLFLSSAAFLCFPVSPFFSSNHTSSPKSSYRGLEAKQTVLFVVSEGYHSEFRRDLPLMSTKMPSKACPQVVKLDMAQNLAKAWVKNMSRIDADESSEVDFEGRPPRLGLGAKMVPKSKVTSSTDPVERKLLMKLDIKKKIVAKSLEESNKTNKGDDHSDNDDDNDPESRAGAFIKKRAAIQPTSFPAKKKKR